MMRLGLLASISWLVSLTEPLIEVFGRGFSGRDLILLIGGAFAFSHYAHVPRDTKDIDIFVKPEDMPRVLEGFRGLGYETKVPFPHWLGKIHKGEHFMDVIFSSGNGLARVDDQGAAPGPQQTIELLGREVTHGLLHRSVCGAR